MSPGKKEAFSGPVVFIHLARCGGTTLTNLLDLHYANRRILKANLLHAEGDDLVGILGHTAEPFRKPLAQARYDLIAGHNNLGDLEPLFPGAAFITMLRHPVDRVVSLYNYWRSHRREYVLEHDLRGPRLAQELSLEEFVESDEPEAHLNVNNGMARQLFHGLVGDTGLNDADLLRLARDRLDRFAFAGITEMYDLSVVLLCYTLGWDPPEATDDANRYEQNLEDASIFSPSADRARPSEKTVARLLEKNRVDLGLYRHAVRRFQQRSAAMLNELRRDPGRLKGRRPILFKRAARRLDLVLRNYLHPR